MKWDYLVETVYDDFSLIPAGVPPNRLMTNEERKVWLQIYEQSLKGPLPKEKVTDWTFQKYLQYRGEKGWEVAQAVRLAGPIPQEGGGACWRIIFKRPSQDAPSK